VASPVFGVGGEAEAVLGMIAPVARHSEAAEESAVAAIGRAVSEAG